MLTKVHDQQTIKKEVTKRKLSYKTTRRRPNSQNHHQKKEKTPFSEQRQCLTIEDGLHHKKLLEFKEEQNIYTTNRTTGYIDNLTK
jgi:transposase